MPNYRLGGWGQVLRLVPRQKWNAPASGQLVSVDMPALDASHLRWNLPLLTLGPKGMTFDYDPLRVWLPQTLGVFREPAAAVVLL